MGTILLVVGCIVGAALLGMAWATFDKKNEVRRRAFGKLAVTLRKYGLERLPAILEDYQIGDYSGFFQKIRKFADSLDDGDDVVIKDFNLVFERVLAQKLATPDGLALLKAKVAEAEKPATVALVA
jgi:hypothetical protein